MACKVIIVGGGISGLSAAQRLCKEGGYDVTILEAEDRIGGRLHTVDIHGHKIELGAQWLHGTKTNVLYELLSKELDPSELTLMGQRYYPVEGSEVTYMSGRKIPPQVRKLFDQSPNLIEDVKVEMVNQVQNATENQLKNVNLLAIVRKVWDEKYLGQEEFKDLGITDTEPILRHVLCTMHDVDGAHAVDSGCLAYYYYLESIEPDVSIPRGFSSILDMLRKQIPTSAIKLRRRVKCIHWNEGETEDAAGKNTKENEQHTALRRVQNGVQLAINSPESSKVQNARRVMVEYINDGGDTCAMYADHVIVTVSLGCLKKYHEVMFRPKLSLEKQFAIQKMGFGVMNEILLYYEKKFWDGGDAKMNILWDSYEGDVFSGPKHWCREINWIETVKDHFLLVWINESASKVVRSLSPGEVSKTIVELVKKIKNDITIPLPDDVIITNWDLNKNFLGTYSYTGVGETLDVKKVLSEPIWIGGVPRVLFAGEAMHESRFSTLDGAYLTGIQEAERIINHASKSKL